MKFSGRFAATAMVVLVCAFPSWAAIVAGGDPGEVSPADPSTWTSSTTAYVGQTSVKIGTITVDAGSSLLSNYGYVGYGAGSVGTATVTGTGSTWTNSGRLYLGSTGVGYLTIAGGGKVSNTVGYLGYASGSSGTASVTGTGSTWTNTSSALYVGYSGTGSLAVADGGASSNTSGYVAYNAGSAGTVRVTGSGATWTNGSLYVGNSGTGSMTIADSGEVSSSYGYVGYNSGSSGTVLVTGTASTWSCSLDLWVGYNGVGSLTVENGGTASARTLFAGASDLKGDGTITVRALVSDTSLVFDAGHGTNQTLAFGSGGTLNLTYDNMGSGSLGAGYRGTASLTIADGVRIQSRNGYLGYQPGSFGTATVNGAWSAWTSYNTILVGSSGTGVLRIQGGASVRDDSGYLGVVPGSSGTVIVTGPGSTWTNNLDDLSTDPTGVIYIGNSGVGTLTIEAGGTVSATFRSYLGYSAGSSGTATVTGTGSVWSGEVDVGVNGTGSLVVSNGGKINGSGMIGAYNGSMGTALVTGTGSMWAQGAGGMTVGNHGAASLAIANGGKVSVNWGVIGMNSDGVGVATVTGTGSVWTNSGTLTVGDFGCGRLVIADGGQVSSAAATIGSFAGSTGTATITGTGSAWTSTDNLQVGGSAPGLLTVADNGKVAAKGVTLSSYGTAVLRVSGNGLVVVGTSGTVGSIANYGKINLGADAFLTPGTYSPITEYAGRAITWSGTGTYNATGGVWSGTNKTFTVSAATALAAGDVDPLTTGERVLFADSAGRRAGASFGTVGGGTTFSATGMDAGQLSGLSLANGEGVLGAWYFNMNFSGGTALVAFDVGLGQSDLKVWKYNGTAWAAFAADDLIYDSHGIASFTTNSFSGYAVMGDVPEPMSACLLAAGAMGLLARRRGGG